MVSPGISRLWHKLRSPWDADQAERAMEDGEVCAGAGLGEPVRRVEG